jgi:hypothetical protein
MSEFEYLDGKGGGIKSNGVIFFINVRHLLGAKQGSEITVHSLVHKPNKQY